MRTYKLTIAYDGSRFRGWQRQPDTDMTIQGILERDISEYVGYKVEVNGSGRTDGGVHASGQTASIILSGKVDEPVFLTEINEKIPEDIRIVNMELARALCPLGIPPLKGVPFLNKSFKQITIIIIMTKIDNAVC